MWISQGHQNMCTFLQYLDIQVESAMNMMWSLGLQRYATFD
jgi:hypothetical protein